MASERAQRRIERLLDQIEQAADQRAWERVQDLAKDVLTLDPDNRDALAFRAAAERATGSPGAASLAPATADLAPTERAPTPVPTSPSTELRTSFAGGRYQVKSFLGEGGKKKVYLAHDTLLGLLAQTMGDLDKAAEHFEDALAFCRKAGYRPELAWTCCDYANLLLQRDYSGRGAAGRAPQGRASPAPTLGAPDHRAKAMAFLDEALAISRELGMRPLMERVLSRRNILTA